MPILSLLCSSGPTCKCGTETLDLIDQVAPRCLTGVRCGYLGQEGSIDSADTLDTAGTLDRVSHKNGAHCKSWLNLNE